MILKVEGLKKKQNEILRDLKIKKIEKMIRHRIKNLLQRCPHPSLI